MISVLVWAVWILLFSRYVLHLIVLSSHLICPGPNYATNHLPFIVRIQRTLNETHNSSLGLKYNSEASVLFLSSFNLWDETMAGKARISLPSPYYPWDSGTVPSSWTASILRRRWGTDSIPIFRTSNVEEMVIYYQVRMACDLEMEFTKYCFLRWIIYSMFSNYIVCAHRKVKI